MVAFRVLIALIILGLLAFSVSKEVSPDKVLNLINSFPRERLILVLLISLLISLIKSVRFWLFLVQNKINLSVWQAIKVYLAGQLTSPLPGGEAMRGVLVGKENGTDLIDVSGPVVSQMFIEFLSAAILAILGSFIYKLLRIPALVVIGLVIVLTLLLTNRKLMLALTQRIKVIPFLRKSMDGLNSIQQSIRKSILDHPQKPYPNKTFLKALTLGIICNLLGGLLLLLITQAYDADLGFFRSTFVYSASVVLTGVGGILPGGLGVTETGMTGILLLSHLGLATAIAIVLMFRIVTLLFNVLIGALVMLIFYSRQLFHPKVAHQS